LQTVQHSVGAAGEGRVEGEDSSTFSCPPAMFFSGGVRSFACSLALRVRLGVCHEKLCSLFNCVAGRVFVKKNLFWNINKTSGNLFFEK